MCGHLLVFLSCLWKAAWRGWSTGFKQSSGVKVAASLSPFQSEAMRAFEKGREVWRELGRYSKISVLFLFFN